VEGNNSDQLEIGEKEFATKGLRRATKKLKLRESASGPII
jgi:hypothetical protein